MKVRFEDKYPWFITVYLIVERHSTSRASSMNARMKDYFGLFEKNINNLFY